MLNFEKTKSNYGSNFKQKHQVLEDLVKNTNRELAACTV